MSCRYAALKPGWKAFAPPCTVIQLTHMTSRLSQSLIGFALKRHSSDVVLLLLWSRHAAATFVHRLLGARLTSGCAILTQDAAGLRTIRELQRGASGVIVLAEESSGSTSTPVAVKLLPRVKAASPALQREMLTQRSCLMHPHVIQVWPRYPLITQHVPKNFAPVLERS